MVVERDLTIANKRGLHARASSRFVKCVEQFQARVTVEKDGTTVLGTSIMGLMLLAAAPGSIIRVAADGTDAEQAIAAISKLVDDRFGEGE
jgi:phosphocarrier protein